MGNLSKSGRWLLKPMLPEKRFSGRNYGILYAGTAAVWFAVM